MPGGKVKDLVENETVDWEETTVLKVDRFQDV